MSSTNNVEINSVIEKTVPVMEVMEDAKTKQTLPEKFKKLLIFEFWFINKMNETNSLPDMAGLMRRNALPIEEQINFYTKFEEEYKEETKKFKKIVKENNKPVKIPKEVKPKRVVKVMYAEDSSDVNTDSLVEKLTKCALKVDDVVKEKKEKVVKEKKEKVVKEKKEKVVKEKKEKVVKEKKEKVVKDKKEKVETTDVIIDVAEREVIVAEREVIVAEREVIVAEREVIVAEPEVIVAEPEVIVAEPEVIVAEPEAVVDKEKKEKVVKEKVVKEKVVKEKVVKEKVVKEKVVKEKVVKEKVVKENKEKVVVESELVKDEVVMKSELVKDEVVMESELVKEAIDVEYIEDEVEESDDEGISTIEITIDGVLYLKSDDGEIYDRETEEHLGTYDVINNTIIRDD